MTVLILAGGELTVSKFLKTCAQECDFVIAADSGIKHASDLGVTPDLIVGDFDSAAKRDLNLFPNVARETHPEDKNLLDLELALERAISKEASDIILMGVTGSRLDQSLAAILIAARYKQKGTPISVHTGKQSLHMLMNETKTLELTPGTLFSLLSLTTQSTLSAKGALYPLERFELEFGVGLGVSNRVKASQLSITVYEGLMIMIVEHKA